MKKKDKEYRIIDKATYKRYWKIDLCKKYVVVKKYKGKVVPRKTFNTKAEANKYCRENNKLDREREKAYSEQKRWIKNNLLHNDETLKPCHDCGFCPYGALVEDYPLRKQRSKYSCKVFGHDCPVFYHAEGITESDNYGGIER